MKFGFLGGERQPPARGAPLRASGDRKFRAAGDRARDLGDWVEAEKNYARHVQDAPDDVAIWVQLGNARKELRDYPGALAAYGRAITLDDADPDAHLQQGHALKLAGRLADAIAAYRRSVERGGGDNPALLELAGLAPEQLADLPDRAAPPGAPRAIYLDLTDLVEYLRGNTTLSGIQRVAVSLVIHAREFARAAGDLSIGFVVPDYTEGKLLAVGSGLIEALARAVTSGQANRSVLDKLVAAIEQSRRPLRPNQGDVLIIPGAFWIYRHYDLLRDLRSRGVCIAVFIHDLIQARNPEYVHKGATAAFRSSFADIAVLADILVTSSNFVASEIRGYVAAKFGLEVELAAIPLATELDRPPSTAAMGDEFRHLLEDGYVLCVGTIEVRKNHMFLIRVWERLIREFEGPIPNLVLVGKWGWDIEELRDYIERSDYLGARLFIYNGVSDTGLGWLFDNCLFTVYPSLAEGWGLPVGESLASGKPCVASNTTSMPEVGGRFCRYIDPHDPDDGYRVISGVLADRAGLAEWARTIRSSFQPKPWRLFAEEFLAAALARAKAIGPGDRDSRAVIETATLAPFGAAALAELDARGERLTSARMSRVSGWHGLEAWGCWAARRRAVLRVRTRLPPGTSATVYLHLIAPEDATLVNCVVKSGDWTTPLDHIGATPCWRAARCAVGAGGVVEFALISGKGFPPPAERGRKAERVTRRAADTPAERERYIGVIALAVAPAGDAESRRRLVAAIVPEP